MTEKVKRIFEDDRPIKSLYWPDDQNYMVGKGDVEKIVPYYEAGQMADVLWFAVFEKGVVASRVNAAHVDTILY